MIVEVYDIEVLSNLFTYTGYDRVSDKWFQFVIHSSCNQYNELMQHLNRDKNIVQVGFNNVNYDYPVLHHLFNHYNEYRDMGGKELAQRIYEKSQQIIEAEFSAVAAKNQYITQIDVFKINHWDNKARHCSLKHCEVAMRMDSVEDMPLHHTHWVTKQEEINMILSYNKHDVKATNMVFDYCLGKVDHPVYRGKNKVALRQTLSKKYKMNLLNHSDVKMGEDLLLHTYCKTIGVPEYLVKKSGTPRKVMHLKDCIPSYINFKTPQFRKLHDKWLHLSIHSTKGAISDSIIFQGIKLDYGTGGIHGSNTGIFEANEDWVIIDSDVGSLYPSIAVQNGYYPEHLGIVFKEIYEDLVVTRLNEKEKPKKERDMVIMEGYKLFVNGAYGKSNEESSFIYDPLYTMKTTITGQLSLTMLIERLTLHIPDIQWIQANTDGITARVPRKDAEVYYKICSMWEKVTKLVLEHAQYSKMIVRDVK